MNNDFTIEVELQSGPGILNRMINTCNRRLIKIKSISAFEKDDECSIASFVLHTSYANAIKVKKQFNKIIEVQTVSITEGVCACTIEEENY